MTVSYIVEDQIMLACGDRAMALHGGEHDGLPKNHPSCVTHAIDDLKGCTPVATPDLSGRLAHCANYGNERHKAGPIYPDNETSNNGQCTHQACLCVVPSDTNLPFFRHREESWDQRCGVEPVTQRVNMMRGMAPHMILARLNVCKRGHPLIGENVVDRSKYGNGQRQCRICMKERNSGAKKQAAS